MSETTTNECARFLIIGRIAEPVGLKRSQRGTSYVQLKLKVKNPKSGRDASYNMVLFGEQAEQADEELEAGDVVGIKGDLGYGRGLNDKWELKFFARQFELIEKAPAFDPDAVDDAMARADYDDVEF